MGKKDLVLPGTKVEGGGVFFVQLLVASLSGDYLESTALQNIRIKLVSNTSQDETNS